MGITIEFSTDAMLDIANAWQLISKGQRFPVAYLETSELFRRLEIDPNELAWQQLVNTPVARAIRRTARPVVNSSS